MMKILTASFSTLLCACALAPIQAHEPSTSYVYLSAEPGTVSARIDIALRDLEMAIGLDSNADGAITWGEVKAQHSQIAQYVSSRLPLKDEESSNPIPWTLQGQQIADHANGSFAVVKLAANFPPATSPPVFVYDILFDIDPTHRALVRLRSHDQESTLALSPNDNQATLSTRHSSRTKTVFWEGMRHIWQGYDHILFLLALLLPSVLRQRHAQTTEGTSEFRPAIVHVIKIVTAFTVAHSITLLAAALQWASLPSRLVESCIAASIILAAGANLLNTRRVHEHHLAFVFGLIHGFGFASAATELLSGTEAVAAAVLLFNAGVEAGQLVIVAIFFPLIYLIRRTWAYQILLVRGGSIAIAAMALVWLIERTVNVSLL